MIQRLSLSIVIPVYNEEDYLKSCLEMIARQTLAPKEVIVVDNNSTDDSLNIARSYPFVKVLKQSRQGVAYARDTGFNSVTADIIGRIDADTQLPDDWVETVINIFENKQYITAVSGSVGFYDLPYRRLSLAITQIVGMSLFYIGRTSNKYLYGSNMALRTNAWRAVTSKVCHIQGNHEDSDLAIHLEKEGYKVHYSNSLTAMISLRRADATPVQAWHYAFSEYRTYKSHDIFSIHGWITGVIALTVYLPLKCWRRAYNISEGRHSFKQLLNYEVQARPHPMD